MNPHLFKRVIGGLVLVTAGVFFLLDRLGLIEINIAYIFSTYWPVILIGYGLIGLTMRERHHWGGAILSLMLSAVGTIFLLKNLQLTDLSLADMFQILGPVALILFGLNVIFRPRGSGRSKDWESIHEAKRQAKEERRAARQIERDKYKMGWENNKWDRSGSAAYSQPKPDEAKRELSDEEKAVLKDIHGEAWDMPDSAQDDSRPKRQDSPRKAYHDSHRSHQYEDYVRSYDSGDVLHRHGFIGDVHLGQEPWELRPIQISHFIGDSVIDLTRASIPVGETPIYVNAFIGDVKIFIPNDIDLEVRVVASSFIGDMKVLDRRESGFMRSVRTQTLHYEEAERKLIVTTSMFIGDITIKKIG